MLHQPQIHHLSCIVRQKQFHPLLLLHQKAMKPLLNQNQHLPTKVSFPFHLQNHPPKVNYVKVVQGSKNCIEIIKILSYFKHIILFDCRLAQTR